MTESSLYERLGGASGAEGDGQGFRARAGLPRPWRCGISGFRRRLPAIFYGMSAG